MLIARRCVLSDQVASRSPAQGLDAGAVVVMRVSNTRRERPRVANRRRAISRRSGADGAVKPAGDVRFGLELIGGTIDQAIIEREPTKIY